MKNLNQRNVWIGGAVSLLIATSCCWLPVVVIGLGGASSWLAISESLGQWSGLFFLLAAALFVYGVYLFLKRKGASLSEAVVLPDSMITCPECGFQENETMPTDACQFFYECKNCKKILKPNKGDCCVYCSYGTVPCPPIQMNKDCC